MSDTVESAELLLLLSPYWGFHFEYPMLVNIDQNQKLFKN